MPCIAAKEDLSHSRCPAHPGPLPGTHRAQHRYQTLRGLLGRIRRTPLLSQSVPREIPCLLRGISAPPDQAETAPQETNRQAQRPPPGHSRPKARRTTRTLAQSALRSLETSTHLMPGSFLAKGGEGTISHHQHLRRALYPDRKEPRLTGRTRGRAFSAAAPSLLNDMARRMTAMLDP